MRILVLSYYYPPDLSAGSFRAGALIEAMRPMLPAGVTVDVITTQPNRYSTFERTSEAQEIDGAVTVTRIPVPAHKSGVIDQSRTFLHFASAVSNLVGRHRYDLVYATSSRLMTAFLGAQIARAKAIPLYLDIRDIFVDTIQDVFAGARTAALLPMFSWVESFTIGSATRVNLVSQGFEGYFRARYPKADLEFFTNGVDDEFVSASWPEGRTRPGKIRVLYAGNIGQGQGLHAIVPALAAATSETHEFTVVGDGGARRLLEQAIAAHPSAPAVSLVPPVGRDVLLQMYRDADVLFLHLNDVPAFEKVLPSKLFEYAATGKPVLAGVAGFARAFVEREVTNARAFTPCDASGGLAALRALQMAAVDRSGFIRKYRRSTIMHALARRVLETGGIVPRPTREEPAHVD